MTHKDITLGQMQEILNIMRKGYDEATFIIKVLAIALNKEESEIEKMRVDEVKKLAKKIESILQDPKETVPPTEVVIDGVKYNVTLNMQHLTMGQYIDMQVYLSECQDDVINNVHKLISTLLLDEQGNRLPDVDLAKKINYQDAHALLLFFSKLNNTLRWLTKHYLKTKNNHNHTVKDL